MQKPSIILISAGSKVVWSTKLALAMACQEGVCHSLDDELDEVMDSLAPWSFAYFAVFSSKKVAENDLASAFICVYHSNFRTPSRDLLNSDPYWGASTGRVWHVAPSARGEQCRYVRSWETMLGKKMRSFCYFLSIELPLHFWNHDWTNRYSPRFAWGGRPHRRFISVRDKGLRVVFPRGGSPS